MLALDHERLELDLDVEAAGVPPRSLGVEAATLDQQHLDAGPRKLVRGGAARQPATDHERVAAPRLPASRLSSVPERKESMMPTEFRGSYSVIVTPFSEDGSQIDIEALRGFLDWQLESGVPGVIVLGTTGSS